MKKVSLVLLVAVKESERERERERERGGGEGKKERGILGNISEFKFRANDKCNYQFSIC